MPLAEGVSGRIVYKFYTDPTIVPGVARGFGYRSRGRVAARYCGAWQVRWHLPRTPIRATKFAATIRSLISGTACGGSLAISLANCRH